MNLKTILGSAVMAGLMTACNGASDNSALTSGNASTADSVLYYFGQMRAAEYWRQAKSDTTLATESARQAYMRGIRAGIDAVKQNEEAYNQGVMMGVQLALNMADFSETYQVKFNNNVVIESLTAGLRNDSVLENREIQKDFYGLMNRLNAQRDERYMRESAQVLAKEESKAQMTMIDSTLYATVVKPGEGELLRTGQRVKVAITVSRLDGQEVKMRMPHEVTLGDRYIAAPIAKGVATMRPGEVKEFLTTASCLFGQRCKQVNLEPTQPLRLRISVDPSGPQEPAKSPVSMTSPTGVK